MAEWDDWNFTMYRLDDMFHVLSEKFILPAIIIYLCSLHLRNDVRIRKGKQDIT